MIRKIVKEYTTGLKNIKPLKTIIPKYFFRRSIFLEVIEIYKISIIIPVYNLEDLIERSFNSILNQTIGFNNLEVIYVDDCSTDKSKNKIMKLSEKYDNVKGVYLNENSGFGGKPRNVGLQHASSEYIMFLDSDDYYVADACEILYNKIISEDVDFVSGNFAIGSQDNIVRWNHVGIENEIKISKIDEKPSLFVLSPAIWSKIYRKDLLLKNNICFDEKLPGQDALFMYKILLHARGMIFVNIPLVIYCHRDYRFIKEKSITDNLSYKKLSDYLTIYGKMYDLLYDYKQEYTFVISSHLSYWSNLLNKSNIKPNEKVSLLKDFSELFKKINNSSPSDNELYDLLENIETNIMNNLLYRFDGSKYVDTLLYNIEQNSLESVDELKHVEDFIYDNKLDDFKVDFLLFKILKITDLLDSAKYVGSPVVIPENERVNEYVGDKHLNYSKYYGSTSKYVGFSYEYSENIFLKIKNYLNDEKIKYDEDSGLNEKFNIPHKIEQFKSVFVYDSYEEYIKNCSPSILTELIDKKDMLDLENSQIEETINKNKEKIDSQKQFIEENFDLLSNKRLRIKELDYEYELLKEENSEITSKLVEVRQMNENLTNSNIWQLGLKFRNIKEKILGFF